MAQLTARPSSQKDCLLSLETISILCWNTKWDEGALDDIEFVDAIWDAGTRGFGSGSIAVRLLRHRKVKVAARAAEH